PRRRERRKESYTSYISQGVEAIHPDTGEVPPRLMSIMNLSSNGYFRENPRDLLACSYTTSARTITSRESPETAVSFSSGELAKHAALRAPRCPRKIHFLQSK
ncbi:UNVERIFIED_CONTAM: hypothetical protein GTU68_024271, partial [Idotea baltica]|nr:hypothetical protein [Idotea baltica]